MYFAPAPAPRVELGSEYGWLRRLLKYVGKRSLERDCLALKTGAMGGQLDVWTKDVEGIVGFVDEIGVVVVEA